MDFNIALQVYCSKRASRFFFRIESFTSWGIVFFFVDENVKEKVKRHENITLNTILMLFVSIATVKWW